MKSKQRHEGYFFVDNRNSPGVPDELIRTFMPDAPAGMGRGKFECKTITCSHCKAVVMVNPLRIRERAYCPKCDHYICDNCGAIMAKTLECRPYEKLAEQIQEAPTRKTESAIVLPS